MASTNDASRFPLLDSLLETRGLKREAIYTTKTTAAVFDVSSRTIDDWCAEGRLVPRDLPGHGRFLNEDLEEFLQRSKRPRKKGEDKDGDDDGRPS